MDFLLSLAATKNTGRWSQEECSRFNNAYATYGKDWKQIAKAVGTRSLLQVRSHGQKIIGKLPPNTASSEDSNERTTHNGSLPMYNKMYDLWLYHTLKAAEVFQSMRVRAPEDLLAKKEPEGQRQGIE